MTAGLARQAEVIAMARKEPDNAERLAAALRENLRRRKAQSRELEAGDARKKED